MRCAQKIRKFGQQFAIMHDQLNGLFGNQGDLGKQNCFG